MVTWFVGQRFRVVRSDRDSGNIGITGRITHIGNYKYGDTLPSGLLYVGNGADCHVSLDSKTIDGWYQCPAKFSQLEPILPEGAQPSEFSFSELMDNLGVVLG